MELTIENLVINKESDFIEDGIDKVKADISIICRLTSNNIQIAYPVVIPIEVVNLNSETGVEMDSKRETEANNLINKING